MKKNLFLPLLFLLALGFSSCATKTYTTSELQSNYALKMTTKKEKALAEKITVFMSEREVQKPFEVISIKDDEIFNDM